MNEGFSWMNIAVRDLWTKGNMSAIGLECDIIKDDNTHSSGNMEICDNYNIIC